MNEAREDRALCRTTTAKYFSVQASLQQMNAEETKKSWAKLEQA